jgi:hybrid cluster-associated redox disulfide protein
VTNKTEKIKKVKINKKMTIGEAFSKNPEVARVLAESGLLCGCCPMAMKETLEQGAKLHNLNIDKIISEINRD